MIDENIVAELTQALMQEKAVLETELADIGTRDNQNKDDWHATTGELHTGVADAQVLADRIEEGLTNEGIVSQLEKRHQDVEKALERIENGTYGVCSVDGGAIPVERLRANPAADTCVEHA